MNFQTLTGNLGKDPSIKQTPSGKYVAELSVATQDGYGEKKETSWHNVVARGKLAEKCVGLKKGSRVNVSGKSVTQSWVGKDSKKQYKQVCMASDLNVVARHEDAVVHEDTSDHLLDLPF